MIYPWAVRNHRVSCRELYWNPRLNPQLMSSLCIVVIVLENSVARARFVLYPN
ncbi:MAG: hypothetical protein F6J98_28345 [Moorea sp. SIO4G2]|uniref:hypothetical protein n=1 Tax=unclassified Moorena TaxID=2683338 RepID=UPI0013FCE000|nr:MULTISPECIES: hypothetical protein [unclassified Moorena]NEO16256.1 hypothetical protein [Moorena sp. SIO3E8]NEO64114.1 hypothetical protein [Moorena sp. SIO4G2]NEP21560.1 hypothetical protein [Moorena sp. SIO3I6]NEQ02762.1 hypothetical protein [Moorena sp. SIO3F7]